MKMICSALTLALLIAACTAPPPSASPTPLPVPLLLATRPAQATDAAIASITSVPSEPAPTRTPSASLAAQPVIHLQQRIVLRDLPGVGKSPRALAVLGDKVFTANSETNNLAVIQDNRVVRFIPVGNRPNVLAVDPGGMRLYVANNGDKSVSLIENDKVTLTAPLNEELTSLLVFEGKLYGGAQSKPEIIVLDLSTLRVQARLAMPNSFSVINLAGDPVHHRIYADLYEKTAVIDTTSSRILNVLPLKGSYYTLVPDSKNDRLLVCIYDGKEQVDYLVAIEPLTGKEVGRVRVGNDARGGAITGDGLHVYVANAYSNTISVVDPSFMASLMTIPVGLEPSAVALDDVNHRLYIANQNSHSVSVLNTENQKLEATIPLTMFPTALESNEEAGKIYIANASTDSVFVVQDARVVREISVGHHPIDLARDAATNQLFVANRADGTLSVINELDFSVRATAPITRVVSTVAVDANRGRVYTSGVILDKNTLMPLGNLLVRGYSLWPPYPPDFLRVNATGDRLYALAWNGVPGSNSREILYSVDSKTLESKPMSVNGNVSAIVVDTENGRVYSADTHPIGYSSTLVAFDANDRSIISLPIPGRTLGMALNPRTHHLFLAHASSGERTYGPTPIPSDNLVEVIDTQSFGLVATLTMQAPGKMATLGDTIYAVSREDGSVSMIEDAALPIPPSPTPTVTPSPWPTATRATPLQATRQPSATNTAFRLATPLSCAISVPAQYAARWTADMQARTGCPTRQPESVGFAVQVFQRGTMLWRSDEQRIYVLYSDKTWSAFDDTWTSSLIDDSCPTVTVQAGLVKPKRGFGKIWCEQATVRTKIGAATGIEAGNDAAKVIAMERGLLIGNNHVWFLFSDGRWE